MALQGTDNFIASRAGTNYKLEADNLMATILDDDQFIVSRTGANYKVSGAEIKDYLGPQAALIVDGGDFRDGSSEATGTDNLDGGDFTATTSDAIKDYFIDGGQF